MVRVDAFKGPARVCSLHHCQLGHGCVCDMVPIYDVCIRTLLGSHIISFSPFDVNRRPPVEQEVVSCSGVCTVLTNRRGESRGLLDKAFIRDGVKVRPRPGRDTVICDYSNFGVGHALRAGQART